MNLTRTPNAFAVIGAIVAYVLAFSLGAEERSAAINKAFTNGTPMSSVIAVLGANYAQINGFPASRKEPNNLSAIIYKLGKEQVAIVFTNAPATNPANGEFLRALRVRSGGDSDRADSVPARHGSPQTNSTSAGAGSYR